MSNINMTQLIAFRKQTNETTYDGYVFFSLALEKPLEGLHIIVDAGNGAGGFFVVMCYTSKVLYQCTSFSLGSFVMLYIITCGQMDY